jgi:hypothetical protein
MEHRLCTYESALKMHGVAHLGPVVFHYKYSKEVVIFFTVLARFETKQTTQKDMLLLKLTQTYRDFALKFRYHVKGSQRIIFNIKHFISSKELTVNIFKNNMC